MKLILFTLALLVVQYGYGDAKEKITDPPLQGIALAGAYNQCAAKSVDVTTFGRLLVGPTHDERVNCVEGLLRRTFGDDSEIKSLKSCVKKLLAKYGKLTIEDLQRCS
ncbi:unnamed protein product [Callosobruchus maculatus]|uniref:Uncharacterized protein n=1 Tax=Callosobruchus maculatus TaxID=64391 RepID=A0A653CXB6_CALMS|nr:unnamed protein product [Callosobruchus maculatus]